MEGKPYPESQTVAQTGDRGPLAPELDGGRLMVGVIKIAFGVVSLLGAGLVLLIKEPQVHRWLERIVARDRQLSSSYAQLVQQLLNEAQAHSLLLAALLFVGGLAQIVAAFLFLRRSAYGWWVLLAAVVAFLPLEGAQLAREHDAGAGVGLLVDLAVVGYLILRRERLQARSWPAPAASPVELG